MKKRARFSDATLATLNKAMIIGLRAGTQSHRFIGVWVVIVENRAFVRSWSLKQTGWHRVFLKDPHGTIQVAGREIAVRAIQTRSERLKDAVDRAYLQKYKTPSSIKFARDLGRAKSRRTTTELVPL